MSLNPKCAHCHHEKSEHFLEAGACWHIREGTKSSRCSCQRFKLTLVPDKGLAGWHR